MSSELIDYTLIEDDPLPLFQINWEPPKNWESMIAQVQETYLKDGNFGNARLFRETLQQIENIIIAQRHFELHESEKIGLLSFAVLNLEALFLIFSDMEVTEIFSNQIGNDIIISHRTHGRCKTNIKFENTIWDALKIRAQYDSGQPLNSRNPALKFSIQSQLGNFRISLQVQPLSSLGPTFSIRRLPKSAITLDQLIKEKQVTKKAADYLLKALKSRQNIVIAGEPGSGKTTLANALLMHSEKTWRLIIMEDAREISIDPLEYPLLIQYNMPSVGTEDRYQARANEISRLLHRSPDYVFLGEIQNKDDTKVAFEGFAAGIRGMATTHAKSVSGLITRWKDSHELAEDLVSSLDVIVITKREIVNGKVELGFDGIYRQEAGEIHEVN